jgi:hypothetical protein
MHHSEKWKGLLEITLQTEKLFDMLISKYTHQKALSLYLLPELGYINGM